MKTCEYESLRSEIISFEEQQRNVWIYMYVLFTTLFVLGIELSYHLFLVTYIILIPFQVVINRYQWSISKTSTYIRIFYEQHEPDLKWESMHVSEDYQKFYKALNSSFLGIVRYTGATQLGFLASIFFIIFLMNDKYASGVFIVNFTDIVLGILSIGLFLWTLILNHYYRKNHDKELYDIINNYMNSLKEVNK